MKQTGTVLIVDDNDIMRQTLEVTLFNEGYDLTYACDGPEALAKAVELKPDVILLDVMMPEMDGFEVCERLRADAELAEVPIVMVTALDDHASRLTGIKAGADDFVSKPIDHLELRARVQTIIRLNRYRRLQMERAKFEWVVEQADDGYLMLNDEDEIVYANPKARHYLGLSANKNEPISETFFSLVSKQYNAQPQETWATWRTMANGKAQPCYLVRPESQTARAFWLQVDFYEAPVGLGTGWIVSLRDTTQQVALQLDMKGFHEAIFHKFRTPLTGMVVGMELLATYASTMSNDEIIKFSNTALKNIKRLHHEIEDILQYARIATLIEPGATFDLAQLQTVVDQVSIDLDLGTIFVSGIEKLDGLPIKFSQRALELVLREILENSKKFHPEHMPTVEISLSCIGAQEITFQISDNGLTLSPEQLEWAWLPYHQGEKYFTGEAAGMGLGLSTVALVVWGAGGNYRIYNRAEKQGVTIELTLPLADY